MPAQLVFDPWTLAFLLALFALLGALCAYLGAKVFDQSEFMSHRLFAHYRDGWNRRFDRLEAWKKRFIAHHNAEHAAAPMAQGALSPRALEDHLNGIFKHVERHEKALGDLVAANGEFNGLKAFVSAIDTVQAKQEDRLAALERGLIERDGAIKALADKITTLEFLTGGTKRKR